MGKLFAVTLFLISAALGYAGEPGTALNPEQKDIDIDSIIRKVELIPVMINGEKDNRINIVIMNRWTSRESEPYNSPEMKDEFLKDINESLIAALTPGDERAQTAFANYREFFNVYGMWWPDMPKWGEGVDLKVVDAIRDRLFLPWKNEHTGWVTFLVMPNSDGGGGGAARNLENRVGNALIAGNGIGKMLHEISHTCMSIGDEYTAGATGTAANPTYVADREYRRDKIKWRRWIEPGTPLPTPYTEAYLDKIGAFEGCQYHLTGYYRSTAQGCIMGAGVFDNTERMCPVCEQRVAMRVNKLVNPIHGFTPSETNIHITGPTKYHFEIDHISPVPNTQVVRWILNGKTIAMGVDQVEVEFGALKEYELICSLTDETSFIRPDPPFAKYPEREIRWKISNSAPHSDADEIKVKLHSVLHGNEFLDTYDIKPVVTGGIPPYTYYWSTGHRGETLEAAGPGIYDLLVVDSEYRNAKVHYPLYGQPAVEGKSIKASGRIKTSSKVLDLETDVTASFSGCDNGIIIVKVKGGAAPYRFAWEDEVNMYGDKRIFEAENAALDIPGHQIPHYFDASNNAFVQFNGNEGTIIWTIEVVKSGIYPIDFIHSATSRKGCHMQISVNDEPEKKSLFFDETRPLYKGWGETTASAFLKAGMNTVSLSSTGNSGPNIDYLRVPSYFRSSDVSGSERINLKPGSYTVVVTDNDHHAVKKTMTVPEVYPFNISKLDIEKSGSETIRIIDPLQGYTYTWYQEDAPIFKMEEVEKPLNVGIEFTPPGPGNYYVSAKNSLTNAESINRICMAIGKTPAGKVADEMNPSQIGEETIKLWFDASDLDGDGQPDGIIPERGPFPDWKEKTWRNPGKLFVKYEPNQLNGKGVCGFDHVWVTNIGKEVQGFQTIIMVYRESSVTFPGKSPFIALSKYIGKSEDSGKRLFDPETIDDKTKNGKTFLNGIRVDPFSTPNPMDFCILTVELESMADETIRKTEGYWEGSLAEIVIFDRALSDTEREGIEEYLRKKWFSSVDLDF